MTSSGNPIIGVVVKGGQNPRPQNQSIINTSKSNVKDRAAVPVDQSIVNTTKSNTKD
ncbi:MAG TPA: hypothetical protein VEX35_03520 [Allosphingosinicella sp.]|nr:hypothetical protein [Allosphingosinicella sp.]